MRASSKGAAAWSSAPSLRRSIGGSKSTSARQRAAPTRPGPEIVAATTPKPLSEQNTNVGAAGPSSPEPSGATTATPASDKPDGATARETLRVGARVLAAYWNEKREFEGFWLATVKRIDHNEYTLEWFESPEYPAFKSRPQDIAVPHPEFRVSGK